MAGQTATDEQFVAFRVAGETYAAPIHMVNEIIRMTDVTHVPGTPEWVRGVINLRGSLVPVVDLRRRLDLDPEEPTRASRIIVVEVGQGMVGMVVDAVSEVLHVSDTEIEPPTCIAGREDSDLVRGIAKHTSGLIILLDVAKALQAH